MWIMSWTRYGASKFATFISIIGALVRYAGVACIVSGLIPAGIICLVIGVAVHFGAAALAKAVAKKAQAKQTPPQYSAPVQSIPTTRQTPVQNTQSPALRCAKCGYAIKESDKFCNECGNLLASAPTEKTCLRCGAKVSSEHKFCSSCGYEVK